MMFSHGVFGGILIQAIGDGDYWDSAAVLSGLGVMYRRVSLCSKKYLDLV